MRSKVINKPNGMDSAEPSVRSVGRDLDRPLHGDSKKIASESGINCTDYGRKIMKNQSSELPKMFVAARVRDGLSKQGYKDGDISSTLKDLELG